MKKDFLRILILVGSITFLIAVSRVNLLFGQATALPADLTIGFKGPSTASQGEDISGKIKISVKNRGGLEAKNFHVDIILKGWAGPTPPPATEHMCGRGFIMSLKPGQSISTASAMQLPATIPPGIPPGNYELCAIADSTDVVPEGANEGNNTVCQRITITSKILKPHLPPKIPKGE
jgi:hypothetical protein